MLPCHCSGKNEFKTAWKLPAQLSLHVSYTGSPESCPGWDLLSLSLDLLSLSSPCGFKGDEFQSRREKPGVSDLYPNPSEIHFPCLTTGTNTHQPPQVWDHRYVTHIQDFKVWVNNAEFPVLPHTRTKNMRLSSTKTPRRGCCTRGAIDSTRAVALQRSPLAQRGQWHSSSTPSASSTLVMPAIPSFACTRCS